MSDAKHLTCPLSITVDFSILLFSPLRLLSGTGVQGLHGVRRQLPDLRERDDLQPVRRGKYGRDSK